MKPKVGCYVLDLNKGRFNGEIGIVKEFNKEELEKHYNQGATIKKIARMYGYNTLFVKQKLEYWEIPLRNIDARGKIWRSESDEGYITLHINGISYLEHRYIYEQVYGPIPEGWLVHHLNGIKNDNWPENLCAMAKTKHGIDQLFPAFEERISKLEKTIEELDNLVQAYEKYISELST